MRTSIIAAMLVLGLTAGTAYGQTDFSAPGDKAAPPRSDKPADPSHPEGMKPGERTVPDARPAPPPAQTTFAALDKNGDGTISRPEFGANNAFGDFKALDTNADSKISQDEFRAYDRKPKTTPY
jgi:hypothetical protein